MNCPESCNPALLSVIFAFRPFLYVLLRKADLISDLGQISARLLKISAYTIAPSVVKLLNLSIRTSQFPKLWKCAKITVLFKSGDRTNISNYRRRPISILPTLSKILERAVHLQLYQYLITNNFLSNKHLVSGRVSQLQ